MDCQAFLWNCPGCGKRFPHYHKQETCDCGYDLHCGNKAVPGYKWCANHGGPAPSRNFYGLGRGMTTGEKSGFAISRLASKYIEMQKDGLYLSNKNAMEIIWARVQQLAERIDVNEAPERMLRLRKLWEEYKENLARGKIVESVVSKAEIDATFEAAYHDYMAWQQMFEALDLHKKMQESEVKILKDMQAIMTAEDGYEFVAKVMAVMIQVLQDDPKRLKQAQFLLNNLIGGNRVLDSRAIDVDNEDNETTTD